MSNILSLRPQYFGEGWCIATPFDINSIEDIDDGKGGDTKTQPTSIPSPFARIDLARTAFRNINKGIDDPNSQKLVSKMFDLGELLFNYDNISDHIKIEKWDIKDNDGWISTKKLQESSKIGHNRLGKVLEMFLTQDSRSYNFGALKHLHIISYDGYIIGGTSPVTMFFSTPNDHYFDEISIRFGTHKLFDKDRFYIPLYERDIEYQKMWYFINETNASFRSNFKDLSEYIEASKKLIREKNREDIYDHIFSPKGDLLINDEYVKNNFTELDTGERNDVIDILGVTIYKKNTNRGNVITGQKSQFVISSNKYVNGLIPMALQNRFSKDLQYTENLKWSSGYTVPYYVAESWKKNERNLPGLAQKYPWVTVNDLLEPYILKLSYPVNKDKYFFGVEVGLNENVSYLPPIKRDFFDLFDVADLKNKRVIYKIANIGDGEVRVTLGIPINNNRDYIMFEKEYSPQPIQQNDFGFSEPDLSLNEGFILDIPFNTTIYPPIRSGSVAISPNYSIQLTTEKNDTIEDLSLKFISEKYNSEIQKVDFSNGQDFKYRSAPNGIFNVTTKYYRAIEEFDLISVEITCNDININSVLIAEFIRYNGGTNSYVAAIDFGTTNTHVEISQRESDDKLSAPTPLHITSSQLLSIAVLNKSTNPIDLYLSYLYEFIPEKIGNEYSFPIRTVISESSGVDHLAQDLGLFSDFNIPFYYEKENKRKPDKLHTNLKWAKVGQDSYNHTMFFLEELVLLVRNYILMEGGDLSKTKVIWTYPSSMNRAQQNKLKNIWEKVFTKYIIDDIETGKLVSVKESIAPFYHYNKINPRLMSSRRPVLAIDIGGGTTDTVIYYKDKPEALTSFRFAGNAIFGDGFGHEAASSNGFIIRYQKLYKELLSRNKIGELGSYNEDVLQTNISENIISFWFSIEKHPEVKDKNLLSFNKHLGGDDDMRVVFVLFYTAIVYHIIKMMKEKNYPMPSGLIFSGTGSKILQIITTDTDLLTDYTKAVIQKLYSEDYGSDSTLNIFFDKLTPKEATCKGVLRMSNSDFQNNPKTLVYSGIKNRPFEDISYEEAQTTTLTKLIIEEVKEFYKFFFDMSNSFDFDDNFAISSRSLKIAHDELNFNLEDYLNTAIDQKSNGLTDLDKKLEDTLFFYPIIGSINNLAYQLSQRTDL